MFSLITHVGHWLDSYQYLALWLEGIALLAIFFWDRFDASEQHKQTVAQMEIMRNQTRATETAANAALLNAQAVINAERAWITGRVGDDSYRLFGNPAIVPDFQLTVVNSGRTPGLLFRIALKFEKRQTLDDLPPEPPLDITALVPCEKILVVPNEPTISITSTIQPENALSADEINAVRDGTLFLLAYGFIEYTNVIKTDFVNPHKSNFCFVYAVGGPTNHGFQVCFAAPTAYRAVS